MRKLLYVTREMCGGDFLPPEFDLEEFCERLQGKMTGVEVVAADEATQLASREVPLDEHLFHEALGEYCPR